MVWYWALEKGPEFWHFGAMAPLTLLHNPACSKSREAFALLRGLPLTVRDYREDPLSEAELGALIGILEAPCRELVRTKDGAFLAAPFDPEDAVVVARELARRPELMERPVVMQGARAIVARPPERLRTWVPF